jgi:hypothetical protein
MKKFRLFAVLSVLSCSLYMGAAIAHHSHATLDPNDVRILTGTVTKFGWTNPHVFIKVMAPNPKGEMVEYGIEMNNPPSLVRLGWSKNTIKTGDVMTWEGPHDRNKDRAYSGATWVEVNGERLTTSGSSNISVNVTPSTDFSGIWTRDDPGGFKPNYLPPTGWPLNATGQAMVDAFNENQNPALECDDPGPPKSTILPYPHRITRVDDTTILIERDLLDTPRVVHLDRNTPTGEPSLMGYSVGWFEGDVLVIETSNFIADRWGSQTGIDSSEQKHLLERYSLIDGGLGLKAEITLTDPVYLSAPISFDHFWKKLADRDLVDAPCTLESTKLWIEGGYSK